MMFSTIQTWTPESAKKNCNCKIYFTVYCAHNNKEVVQKRIQGGVSLLPPPELSRGALLPESSPLLKVN